MTRLSRAAAWLWLLFVVARTVYRRGFDDGFTRAAGVEWEHDGATL